MEFSPVTRGTRQQVTVVNVIPGVSTELPIPVVNRFDHQFEVKKITVSCGCMVVRDFQSQIPAKSNPNLILSIRSGTKDSRETRQLDFEDSDGGIWPLEVNYKPATIFTLSQPEFTVENDGEVEFELKYTPEVVSSGIVPTIAKDISVASGNAIVTSLKVLEVAGTGIRLQLKPDPARFGLKKVIVETLEISSSTFKTSIEVLFRNPKSVRVSPDKCQALKLMNGRQRFIVMGAKEAGEIDWRWISRDKQQFPIEIVSKTRFGNGEIVEILMSDRDIELCESIELFHKTSASEVLVSIPVE